MATHEPHPIDANMVGIHPDRDNDTDHKDSSNPNSEPNNHMKNSDKNLDEKQMSPSKTQKNPDQLLLSFNHQQTKIEESKPFESVVEYDPFLTPPDLDKAEIHLIASRIALDPKTKEDIGDVIDEIDSVIQSNSSTSLPTDPKQKAEENINAGKSDSAPTQPLKDPFSVLNKYFDEWTEKTKEKSDQKKIEQAAKKKTESAKQSTKKEADQKHQDEDSKALVTKVEEVKSCPCCNRRARTENISFIDGVSQIGTLGAGYVLFFKMNVMVNFINIFNLLLCLYPIIRNSMSSSCKKVSDSIGVTTYATSSELPNCHLDFTTITSLANYNVLAWDIIERILLMVSMLTIVLMSCFWRISIDTISKKYESRADAPDDWTVHIKNIAPEHAQKIFIRNEIEEPIKNLDDYVKALIENCRHKTMDEMNKEEEEERERRNSKKNAVKPQNNLIKEKPNYEKLPQGDIQNQQNSHSSVAVLKPQEKASDLEPGVKVSSAVDLNNSKLDIRDANQNKEAPKDSKTSEHSKYLVVSTNYVYRCKELVALDKNLTTMKKELRKLLEKEPAKDKQENEKLIDMLNPQMNKKQFLGLVDDRVGVNNEIKLDDFSLDFQIKFTKALFVSSKVNPTNTAPRYSQRNPRWKKEVLSGRNVRHFQNYSNGQRLQATVQEVQRRPGREFSPERQHRGRNHSARQGCQKRCTRKPKHQNRAGSKA